MQVQNFLLSRSRQSPGRVARSSSDVSTSADAFWSHCVVALFTRSENKKHPPRRSPTTFCVSIASRLWKVHVLWLFRAQSPPLWLDLAPESCDLPSKLTSISVSHLLETWNVDSAVSLIHQALLIWYRYDGALDCLFRTPLTKSSYCKEREVSMEVIRCKEWKM